MSGAPWVSPIGGNSGLVFRGGTTAKSADCLGCGHGFQTVERRRSAQPVALHSQVSQQAMAPPAFPNPPDPEDMSTDAMQPIPAGDVLVLVRALTSRLQ